MASGDACGDTSVHTHPLDDVPCVTPRVAHSFTSNVNRLKIPIAWGAGCVKMFLVFDWVLCTMDIEESEYHLIPDLLVHESTFRLAELFVVCHRTATWKTGPHTYVECLDVYASSRPVSVYVITNDYCPCITELRTLSVCTIELNCS